eukprot:2657372-Rhodomonas_salina.1
MSRGTSYGIEYDALPYKVDQLRYVRVCAVQRPRTSVPQPLRAVHCSGITTDLVPPYKFGSPWVRVELPYLCVGPYAPVSITIAWAIRAGQPVPLSCVGNKRQSVPRCVGRYASAGTTMCREIQVDYA